MFHRVFQGSNQFGFWSEGEEDAAGRVDEVAGAAVIYDDAGDAARHCLDDDAAAELAQAREDEALGFPQGAGDFALFLVAEEADRGGDAEVARHGFQSGAIWAVAHDEQFAIF